MKKIMVILTMTLLYFPLSRIYSQDTKNINDILVSASEASEKIQFIYDLDVFNYNKIYDYDTELKREVFKKTVEYQNYLSELKKLKIELLKSIYYTKTEKLFMGTDYDIKRKGFDITFGQNWGIGTASAVPPKSRSLGFNISNMGGYFVQFKGLTSRQIPDKYLGDGIISEKLFIPVNETSGLEIEENRNDIDIYYLFTPTGKETVKYKYFCTSNGWYNMTDKVITANKVRVLVANRSSGKVYFDKSYVYTPQPITK